MTWRDALRQPDVGVRFALFVEGISTVFLDSAAPVGPDGTAWPALSGGSGVEYSLAPNALDTTAAPLRDAGPEISRSQSQVTPSSMRFVLRDRDDALLALFARHRTSGRLSNLAATVEYDAGSGTADVTLESAAGWAEDDFLFMGRETMQVLAVTGDVLTCRRALFAMAYSDTVYRHRADRPTVPRVVADYPRTWIGRYVSLRAWIVSSDGVALDDDWLGPYSWEAWRGVLDAQPRPTSDWHSWELSADSIEAILQTEVGYESARGTLLRVATWTDTLAANREGAVTLPDGAPPGYATYYIGDDTNLVHVLVRRWDSAADKAAGVAPDVWDYRASDALELFDLSAGAATVSRETLRVQFAEVVSATLRTDTGLPSVALHYKSGNGSWTIWIGSDPGGYVWELTWDWTATGSVGVLLGWEGTSVQVSGQANVYLRPERDYAIVVTAAATKIPFFYEADGLLRPPPSDGYAIIGEDDQVEVVRYQGITSLTGYYLLTNCLRGQLGTSPREHRVSREEHESGSDAVRLRFGVGWSSSALTRVLLELATSTGFGEHGAYDVLPAGAGAALNPLHFDVTGFEALAERLAGWERDRTLILVKSTTLAALVSGFLQPLGRYVYAATIADGSYRITVGETLPALASEVQADLGLRDISADRPAVHEDVAGRLINQVRALYRYDPVKGECDDKAYVDVLDDDSIAEHGTRKKVEWSLLGWRLDPQTAAAYVIDWASDVFRRFGRPADVLTVRTGRRGWLLRSGQTVSLTLPALPTSSGVRGADALPATVLQVAKTYTGPDVGAEVRVLVEGPERHTTYAPAARITGAAADDTYLELAEAEFSRSGSDGAMFAVGYAIFVYEDETDAASRVMRTIVAHDGAAAATLTLDEALPSGWTLGAASLITFADYANVTAAQRRYAYLASNDAELDGVPSDAVRYV